MGDLLRVLAAGLTLLASASRTVAQDPIGAAKELYASAAYEEALVAFEAAKERGSPEVARQADEYRAFCLLALGRTSEAEAAAESAIRQNPLASLDSRDASPRIEEMFKTLRRRLLPGLIRDAFRAARDKMNKGDSTAVAELAHVRLMLDAARSAGVWDDTLGDMLVLVDGFLDLDRAATVARTQPAAAPPSPSPAPDPPAAGVVPPPAATVGKARAFSAADTDVVPPVVLRQDVPRIPRALTPGGSTKMGVLIVRVDEQGNVQEAFMRESINSAVDAELVKAAFLWRYRPATRAGRPVPFIKVIAVDIEN